MLKLRGWSERRGGREEKKMGRRGRGIVLASFLLNRVLSQPGIEKILNAVVHSARVLMDPEKGFKNHAISRPSEFGGGRTSDDDDDDDVSSHKGKA